MANAWILEPRPATVLASAGTVQIGPPANVLNDYAGVVCQIACTDGANYDAYLDIDLGSDQLIDTVMMFGVELIFPGAKFFVSYATAAQRASSQPFTSTPTAPPYAGTAPTTSGKGVSLWSLAAPVTARYLLVGYSAGAGAPGNAVRMSRLVVGRRVSLERNFGYGAAFGVRDLGSLDFSARGVLLRRRARKLRTVGLTFSNVRKDEVEASTKPLLETIGNTEMIALVTDPAVHAQRQSRCYFGPLVGDLSHVWRNAAAFEAKINLVSIF